MKYNHLIPFVVILVLVVMLQSCEKDNETKISSYNSSESHKDGENCMSCHTSGSSGEGWFIVAGTIYNENLSSIYPNATVKLFNDTSYTDLAATIEVDNLGNYYTTQNIDFGNGLYISVVGANTNNKMIGKITSGQCNSCHGVSTDRIWTK